MNKKNLKLKNITFMSPLTHSRSNFQNVLSDSTRVVTTTSNLSSYLHRGTQIINELYRSSSNNSSNHSKFSKISVSKKPSQNYRSTYSSSAKHKKENLMKSQSTSNGNKIKVNSSSYLSTGISPSTSMNNIKIIYNEITKKVKSGRQSSGRDLCYSNSNKNFDISLNNKHQLSTKDSTVMSLNNKLRSVMKNSLTSNSNTNTNSYEGHTMSDIDTPEELHFFYVGILQNGRKVERKFEK